MNDYNDLKQYIDYKVYNITKIRDKYGFRILLIFGDNTTQTVQRSGYRTKKEAEDFRNKTIVELHNGLFVIEKSITIKEFFIEWLESEVISKMTHYTYATYKNIIKNHIIKRIGNIKINELSRAQVMTFYNDLSSYSHSVLKNARIVLRTGIRHAINNKIVSVDPTEDVELPRQVKRNKYRTSVINIEKTLTIDQVKVLIEESKSTQIHLEVMFAVLMGLRKGEIRGLKYEDIDYVNKTIRIQRQLGSKHNIDLNSVGKSMINKQEIKVKTFSSNRLLEIPDILFDAILVERKKYEKNRSRRINDKTTPFKDLGYICCSTYGNPRSSGFLFNHYKKLLKEASLPDIRFHDLRSTYCTILVGENFSPKAISKLMGHASEIISIDVYTDNSKIIEDCLSELEPFIESVRPKLSESTADDEIEDLIEMDTYINSLLN